jgi:GWxTD domain-containing protein
MLLNGKNIWVFLPLFMRALYHIGLLLIAFCALVTCRSIKNYSSKPGKSGVFADEKQAVDIELTAYHLNDTVTQIAYRVATDQLMFRREDTTQVFYASVQISCKLIPEINSRQIIDSASAFYRIKLPETDSARFISGFFLLKINTGNLSFLDFWISDRNKNVKHTSSIFVNKINEAVAQNFQVYGKNGLFYKSTFYPGEEVFLKSSRNTNGLWMVECFLREFPPALPPFSTQKPDELKYKPDSVFSLSSDNSTLTIPQKGFVHVRSKTQNYDGLSLYSYEKAYPGVSDVDEMINCTRYIMSKDEFRNCKTAIDPKACIDQFWLGIAGSNERAKELLKKYYNRVKEANKRFTSYTQGWKTDRGMIYVVFGEPVNIYQSRKDEVWIYGSEVDVNTLKFTFKHSENPFSDNDFILQRSFYYKEPWYTAVDYWRQGRISRER